MTVTANASSLPNTDAEAITFALDHLEPFEAADFLSDWRDGRDLTPWLNAWHQDRRAE